MAASMRLVIAASSGSRIHLKLLSPPLMSSLTRCVNQMIIPKTAPARVTSTPTTSVRGVSSAPLIKSQPSFLQQGQCKGEELSKICSRLTGLSLGAQVPSPSGSQVQMRTFSSLVCSRLTGAINNNECRMNEKGVPSQVLAHQPHRTVVRFSKNKGKKKTVKAVIARFRRLDNGLWVRTQAGRAKKLWKKSPQRRYRLKQHIFCNQTQSLMLDRMVSGYWKKKRHFLDDPFEQYHQRYFDVIPEGTPQKYSKPKVH